MRAPSRRLDPALFPVEAHLAHLRLRGLSEGTVGVRRSVLGLLARFLEVEAGPALLSATADDLEDWQHGHAHLKASTRASYAAQTAVFYQWAADLGLIPDNPALRLVRPRQGRRVPRPFAPDDVTLAINCAPPRVRPWLVLAAYAGLRAAEIANLTRDQVRDTARPPVLVVRGKGDKERVVPMSALVLRELQAHGLPYQGHVFLRQDGQRGPNTPATISHLINRYLHSMGIPESCHQLRHYFGSSLYQASKDLRLVQECMGHSSPQTTAGYVSYSHAAAVEAVEAVSAGEAVPGLPGRHLHLATA